MALSCWVKASAGQLQVKYLGHVISEEGVATDPTKTEKVKQWPTPSTAEEVQQFLGLASYYRRFIQHFAEIMKPLHHLTEHNVAFLWTEECELAFQELKHHLVTAPIFSYPDFSKEFVLDTDASNLALGAVLSQVQEDGSEKLIAYGSRLMTKTERRYCATRRELLSAVTIVKQFHPYLLGRHFKLRTDHGSLVWLKNFKEPERQLARWSERV